MADFTASNGLKIIRTTLGFRVEFSDGSSNAIGVQEMAALREFIAQQPKPWEDAKPGEVWALTQGGSEHAYTFTEGRFWPQFRNARPLTEENLLKVTAGRRIWPEGEES